MKTIRELVEKYTQENIEIRRHLHKFPELSTQEYKTQEFICAELEKYGIEYNSNYSKTGVVGIIKGKNPEKRCIALRADMDALPIEEKTDLEFKSVNKGIMHACGHDVHMTCLLGAARILQELRGEFEGSVKLIFQPSEEDYRAGANIMIEEGVLENPKVDEIYALHVLPEMQCGKLGFKEGKYMASTDEVYLKVKGKGGHGATPELNVDTVLMSAYILTGLQQVVSRHAPPYIPTVLSFGRIIGEGMTNIIPNEVNIDGTFRTFDETWRKKAHAHITECAENIAKAMGGSCEVSIAHGYPFVNNDVNITKKAVSIAEKVVGRDNIEELPIRMTAEDFSYFTNEVPGTLFRLGTSDFSNSNTWSNLHTEMFEVDERSIAVGVGMFVFLVF